MLKCEKYNNNLFVWIEFLNIIDKIRIKIAFIHYRLMFRYFLNVFI